MEKKTFGLLALWALCCLTLWSCRSDDDVVIGPATEPVDTTATVPAAATVKGFYLLNEGSMGSNKCTLDYMDLETGEYVRNIFPKVNPGVVQELGDVGNDLQVYGDKLWAVVNCSHLVEVMDSRTARHITQLAIPNCRYVVFDGDYAYVSSYAGPVAIDPNARLGYVARVNVNTLQVVDSCVVGYQPEEMAVVGGKLYVANSGGYRVPNYDRTVSVIDLASFKTVKTIDVAINLHRMEKDSRGMLWVSSRGDYYDVPSRTYVIDPATDRVVDSLDVANSEMTLCGDSLYLFGSEWSYVTNSYVVSYAVVNTLTRQVVSRSLIADEAAAQIRMPYGIAVNPDTRDIYLTDAGDYVSPGHLYCFGPDGRQKWKVRTGDIPAHFAFTTQRVTLFTI